MTTHPHRARGRLARGTVSVALVLALAGALFAANARLARSSDERHPVNLADLSVIEVERLAAMEDRVAALRDEVDQLTAEQTQAEGSGIGEVGAGHLLAAGREPVTGPGLTVTLTDAPVDGQYSEAVRPDDLLVHQQDLQAVINALWAGGGEAMALMDQRVISTSAFQCVGNTLQLHGRVYSPPYVVRAIGDPDELRAALAASPEINDYLAWVDAVGLGWQVEEHGAEDPLELPDYTGPSDLRSARVPDGTEVLPGLPPVGEPLGTTSEQG